MDVHRRTWKVTLLINYLQKDMVCFNHVSALYLSNNIMKNVDKQHMQVTNCYWTQKSQKKFLYHGLASLALNISCSFGQSVRSIVCGSMELLRPVTVHHHVSFAHLLHIGLTADLKWVKFCTNGDQTFFKLLDRFYPIEVPWNSLDLLLCNVILICPILGVHSYNDCSIIIKSTWSNSKTLWFLSLGMKTTRGTSGPLFTKP